MEGDFDTVLIVLLLFYIVYNLSHHFIVNNNESAFLSSIVKGNSLEINEYFNIEQTKDHMNYTVLTVFQE